MVETTKWVFVGQVWKKLNYKLGHSRSVLKIVFLYQGFYLSEVLFRLLADELWLLVPHKFM